MFSKICSTALRRFLDSHHMVVLWVPADWSFSHHGNGCWWPARARQGTGEVTGCQGVHHHRRLSPTTTEVLSVWTAGLLEAPWLHQAQNMGLWELCLLERERNYPQLLLRNPNPVTLFPHSISISGQNRSPCRVWQIRRVSEEDSF